MPVTLTDEQYKALLGQQVPGQMMAPLPGSPEAVATGSPNTTLGTGSTGSGTGTSGGGSPYDPNAPANSGMAPLTGFAGRYNPSMLQNTIYDNPYFVLRDVFSGINESSPGYQALRDFGADPLALFNIMQGSNQTIASGDKGAGAFANFLADLYQQLGTAGGQGLSSQGLLGNIFGQNTQDPKTTLGNILVAGDMGQQIRTLFNLVRDVSSATMNPLAASGYQAAMARAGDRYGNAQLQQDAPATQHMVDYIKQNMPWLAV